MHFIAHSFKFAHDAAITNMNMQLANASEMDTSSNSTMYASILDIASMPIV